jgi:hypothetical protein
MSSAKKRMLGSPWIVPVFILLGGCGEGGNGGEDAAEDQGGDPDATDGDAASDPRPDDPAGEDAARDDTEAGDEQPDAEVPAEVEDTPSEEIPGPPVDCGGTVCSGTQECCLTTDPPWLECVDVGTCEGDVLACDEQADCPGIYYDCCYLPGDNNRIECLDDCPGGPIVCGSNEDCKIELPFCCPAFAGLIKMCREHACE